MYVLTVKLMEVHSTRYSFRINTGVAKMNERSDDIAEISDGTEVLYKNNKSFLIMKV